MLLEFGKTHCLYQATWWRVQLRYNIKLQFYNFKNDFRNAKNVKITRLCAYIKSCRYIWLNLAKIFIQRTFQPSFKNTWKIFSKFLHDKLGHTDRQMDRHTDRLTNAHRQRQYSSALRNDGKKMEDFQSHMTCNIICINNHSDLVRNVRDCILIS